MSDRDTLRNALVGALVSLVLFFLPFSPALGGGVAGYLQGPDRGDGLRVGALSGAIATIPGALLFALVLGFFVVVGPGTRSALLVFLALLVTAGIVIGLYAVALGAAGGFAGAYLRGELGEPTGAPSERLAGTEPVATPDEYDEPMGGGTEGAPPGGGTADAPMEETPDDASMDTGTDDEPAGEDLDRETDTERGADGDDRGTGADDGTDPDR